MLLYEQFVLKFINVRCKCQNDLVGCEDQWDSDGQMVRVPLVGGIFIMVIIIRIQWFQVLANKIWFSLSRWGRYRRWLETKSSNLVARLQHLSLLKRLSSSQ